RRIRRASEPAASPQKAFYVLRLLVVMSSTAPWHGFYTTAFWLRRRRLQLLHFPLCAMCQQRGITPPATVVDHVTPHRGSWDRFVLGDLQSLCKHCHDGAKHALDLRGYSLEVGPDGWPTDGRHPANQDN